MEGARDNGADDDAGNDAALIALKRQQLAQPDRIFVGGAARIGGDAPARLDLAPFDERKDDVGVAGIDREQHELVLQIRKTSPA